MTKKTKPRIALIGCGRWGKNHLKTWHALGYLTAVCDENAETLEAFRKLYPGVQFTTSLEDTLASPEIDAIVIATPAATHASLALKAMAAGKDVLIEKPMALDPAHGRELIEAAALYRRILMVGHVLEYHPAVKKLCAMIRSGEIGKIRYLASNRQNFGAIRTEENALWSFAPHDIAVILRLLESTPERVACHGGEYLNAGIADVTLTVLSFPNNIHGHIYVSWLYPFKVQRFVIVGEKKMAVFDDTRPWAEKLILYSHEVDWIHGQVPVARKADGEHIPLEEKAPLEAECEHFIHCIRTREKPLTDGESALKVLEVLDLATRSYQQGGIPLAGSPGGKIPAEKSFDAHPTAVIDKGAQIGEGTKIWHYSHVSEGAVLGKRCALGQNVFVAPNVEIGSGVRIQNNVSVYQGVKLEDHVFCGPSVVFTNVINPRAEVSRKDEYKPTLVKRGASLGANCTIVCGNTIGEYAFIGAGSVVTKSVPAYALMVGSPAKRTGWMCACGIKLGGELKCSCGKTYKLTAAGLLEPVL